MFFGQNGGLNWENWKNTTKILHFRINEHYYFSGHVISEFPTATPYCRPCPIRLYHPRHWPTSADSHKQMAAFKRKYIVFLNWHEITTKSQWLPHILDHARRRYARSTWPDIGRHGGQKMGRYKPDVETTDVGRPWAMSSVAYLNRASSQMWG